MVTLMFPCTCNLLQQNLLSPLTPKPPLSGKKKGAAMVDRDQVLLFWQPKAQPSLTRKFLHGPNRTPTNPFRGLVMEEKEVVNPLCKFRILLICLHQLSQLLLQ